MEWLRLHLSSDYIVSSVGFPHGTHHLQQPIRERKTKGVWRTRTCAVVTPLSRIFLREIDTYDIKQACHRSFSVCWQYVFWTRAKATAKSIAEMTQAAVGHFGNTTCPITERLAQVDPELKMSATNCNSYVKSHYFFCSPPGKLPIMRPQELCFSNKFFKAIHVKITVLGMAEVC